MSDPATALVLYRYRASDGSEYFTDSYEGVPSGRRHTAEKITVGGEEDTRTSVEIVRNAGETGAKKADKLGEGLDRAKAIGADAFERTEGIRAQLKEWLPPVEEIHVPSASVGFGTALVAVVLWKAAQSALQLVAKLAVVFIIIALAISAYFGLMRRHTGADNGADRSPPASRRVDDRGRARRSVDRAGRRTGRSNATERGKR